MKVVKQGSAAQRYKQHRILFYNMDIHRLKQMEEKVRSWWQGHGNKRLPESYFNPLTTLLAVYLIVWIYGSYTYAYVKTIVAYVTQKQIGAQTPPLLFALLFFTILTLFMIAIYAILVLILLYLRKRTRFTFTNEQETRKIILQRDHWSLAFRHMAALFVALAYFHGVSPVLLHILINTTLFAPFQNLLLEVLTFVTSFFPDYFPAFITIAILSFFAYLFLNSGLHTPETLPFIADSLSNMEEPQTPKERKNWKKDMNYLANAFVTTISKFGPFDHKIISEVDLTYLKPILLALFLGNTEEKNRAKQMLSELQGRMKEDESKRQLSLIDWLSKTKERTPKAFPRLKKLEETIKMRLLIRRGILSSTPESLKYIAKIIAIVVGLITITSVIFGGMQTLLELIGKA